jgi:SAM-dependent methyltransferase
MSGRLRYGNWIRWKVLLLLGVSALAAGLLGLFPIQPVLRIAAELLSIGLFISFAYPFYLYWMFAPQGGNLQDDLYELILQTLGEEVVGEALDIGTGNGILAVKLAQRHPSLRVTGLDYWGRNWEYSQSVCDENARVGKVSERVRFVKGDAAKLDFDQAVFDVAVSNLTFHEVKSARQKRDVVREALRVVKPGGRFVFVDYFFADQHYGDPAGFEEFLSGLGLARVTLRPLGEVLKLSPLLRHRRALGRVGILSGVK